MVSVPHGHPATWDGHPKVPASSGHQQGYRGRCGDGRTGRCNEVSGRDGLVSQGCRGSPRSWEHPMHLLLYPYVINSALGVWFARTHTGHAFSQSGYELPVADVGDGDLWLFCDHTLPVGLLRAPDREEANELLINHLLPDADRGLLRTFAKDHPQAWDDGLLPPHCHYRTERTGRERIRSSMAQAPPAGVLWPLTTALVEEHELAICVYYRDIFLCQFEWTAHPDYASSGGSRLRVNLR